MFWDLCTTNDLSSSWYNLVWYAPYDKAWDLKMYANEQNLTASSSQVNWNTCVPDYNQDWYFTNSSCLIVINTQYLNMLNIIHWDGLDGTMNV